MESFHAPQKNINLEILKAIWLFSGGKAGRFSRIIQ